MDDDTLSLGTEVATWAIKDFSVTLRQQITKAARQQGCNVAEWLHGHFQKYGVDGQQFNPVKIAQVEPGHGPDSSAPLSRLLAAAEVFASCRDGLPDRVVQALARRLIREANGDQSGPASPLMLEMSQSER